ncbi:MAG TPA: hypothetical protein VHP37_07635 [Burkholderiales bacterium]|nr:hypothetical protein [Burkholderiales bacterium]
MKKNTPQASAPELIDSRIEELGDWRGEMLALHEARKIDEKALKALIRAAVILNTSPVEKRPTRKTPSPA